MSRLAQRLAEGLRSESRSARLPRVDITSVQECLNDGYMTEVIVRSHTDRDRLYTVLVQTPDETQEVICECEGYVFRGYCKHQKQAMEALCKWTEKIGPEAQTNEQRKDKICPRCGGPTEWRMDWDA